MKALANGCGMSCARGKRVRPKSLAIQSSFFIVPNRRSRGKLRDATTWGVNTSGPGRVDSDLSMKTKTYFAFRVDIWDATGDNIVEHVAGVDDLEVAEATYRAAVARWPAERITLGQGIRVVHNTG